MAWLLASIWMRSAVMPQPWRWLCGKGLFKDMILEPQLCRWLCREDLFKDMMSEWEDVAAKHARCMAGHCTWQAERGGIGLITLERHDT